MQKKLKTPTLFHFKGHNIFAFSDTHGRHRQITVPQQTDILICAGDAVEDNLDPADYQDFLAWYKKQPAKLRLFIPGNYKRTWDAAKEYRHPYNTLSTIGYFRRKLWKQLYPSSGRSHEASLSYFRAYTQRGDENHRNQ